LIERKTALTTMTTTLLTLLAQATAPATTPNAPPSILQGPLVPLLLGVAVLYFFVFRAKRKQDQGRNDLLQKLKPGQRVQTIGGILGTITQVNEREVTIKVDETNNVKIKFVRNAIHRVQDDDAKTETK
jgi:preprotein translocase subunit YajC